MRAYFFGNMYLSSMQQGLQAGHCIADMFLKYNNSNTSGGRDVMLMEWADKHKTIILLNGGYHITISELSGFFCDIDNPYPWAPFHESDEAMGGMQTTVGIILPEKIYEGAVIVRKARNGWNEVTRVLHDDGTRTIFQPEKSFVSSPTYWEFSAWEVQLINKLNTFGLAR